MGQDLLYLALASRGFSFQRGYLALGVAYFVLWSMVVRWLTGDDFYGIGTFEELIAALRFGGIIVVLSLIMGVWLTMIGFLRAVVKL